MRLRWTSLNGNCVCLLVLPPQIFQFNASFLNFVGKKVTLSCPHLLVYIALHRTHETVTPTHTNNVCTMRTNSTESERQNDPILKLLGYVSFLSFLFRSSSLIFFKQFEAMLLKSCSKYCSTFRNIFDFLLNDFCCTHYRSFGVQHQSN